MDTPATPRRLSDAGPRWRKPLLIAAGLLGAGSFIWSQLPDGSYSTELSKIGAGRPAVVLTLDPNFVTGNEVMEMLNAIRPDYEARVSFKVAHLASPEARGFAIRHDAGDGTVLLFGADGSTLAVLHQPRSTEVLRQAVQQAFGPEGAPKPP